MGRKLKNSDRGTAKFIRIRDESLWDVIDQLSALDKYKSDFNKLINNALIYGLPMLHDAESGIVAEEKEPDLGLREKDISGENFLRIVRLLREVIINVNINKALLCSVFRIKEFELDGTLIGRQLSKGYLQDTPACLADYEVRELKKLRDKEDG